MVSLQCSGPAKCPDPTRLDMLCLSAYAPMPTQLPALLLWPPSMPRPCLCSPNLALLPSLAACNPAPALNPVPSHRLPLQPSRSATAAPPSFPSWTQAGCPPWRRLQAASPRPLLRSVAPAPVPLPHPKKSQQGWQHTATRRCFKACFSIPGPHALNTSPDRFRFACSRLPAASLL